MRYQALFQPKAHKRVMRTTCDICGHDVDGDRRRWDRSEVNIEARIGSVWPESDDRTVHEIDCCPGCFLERVKPLLERELGVRFRERDADDFESEAYAVTVEAKE